MKECGHIRNSIFQIIPLSKNRENIVSWKQVQGNDFERDRTDLMSVVSDRAEQMFLNFLRLYGQFGCKSRNEYSFDVIIKFIYNYFPL